MSKNHRSTSKKLTPSSNPQPTIDYVAGNAGQLLKAFTTEIEGQTLGTSLASLEEMLAHGDVLAWQDKVN